MSALFLKLAKTVLFLSSSSITFSLLVVLDPLGEVAIVLPVVTLAPHQLLASVHAVVGLELLATTLAGKHMVSVLPHLGLVRPWKRFGQFPTVFRTSFSLGVTITKKVYLPFQFPPTK